MTASGRFGCVAAKPIAPVILSGAESDLDDIGVVLKWKRRSITLETKRREEPLPVLNDVRDIVSDAETDIHPERRRTHTAVAGAHREEDFFELRQFFRDNQVSRRHVIQV